MWHSGLRDEIEAMFDHLSNRTVEIVEVQEERAAIAEVKAEDKATEFKRRWHNEPGFKEHIRDIQKRSDKKRRAMERELRVSSIATWRPRWVRTTWGNRPVEIPFRRKRETGFPS